MVENTRMTTTAAGHALVDWIGHQMHNEGTIPEFVALEIRAAVVAIEAEARGTARLLDEIDRQEKRCVKPHFDEGMYSGRDWIEQWNLGVASMARQLRKALGGSERHKCPRCGEMGAVKAHWDLCCACVVPFTEEINEDPASLESDGKRWRAAEAEGHVVDFSETGYGLQHPPSCRPDLINCEYNLWLAAADGPEREPGSYQIRLMGSGVFEQAQYVAISRA